MCVACKLCGPKKVKNNNKGPKSANDYNGTPESSFFFVGGQPKNEPRSINGDFGYNNNQADSPIPHGGYDNPN